MGKKSSMRRRACCAAPAFDVRSIPEAHLCCGSAGTYNILQPEIANALRDRKVANIARVKPDVIATGNIGCITQIASATSTPVVHTVELLDWASGGPAPAGLSSRSTGFDRAADDSLSKYRRFPAARRTIGRRLLRKIDEASMSHGARARIVTGKRPPWLLT